MARYLQVSSEIVRDVESGALGPGDELPSIREAAHRYKTTGSTISRAYRHLADAGVIDTGDRRRSRRPPMPKCAAWPGAACVLVAGPHPLPEFAWPLEAGIGYPSDVPGRTAGACHLPGDLRLARSYQFAQGKIAQHC